VGWFGEEVAAQPPPAYLSLVPPFPPRRRRWPVLLTLGIVGVLLLCAAPVAFVASRLPLLPAGRAEAADPSPTAATSPPPGAAARQRVPWVRDQIVTGLDQQAQALIKGDRKAFLATADPKAAKLSSTLKRRFGSLRALKVTRYAQEITNGPIPRESSGGRREWQVRVQLKHCFVTPDCDPDPLVLDTRWAETAGGVRMTSLTQSGKAENGPRPWEVSSLKAAVGKRVVVATTSRYAARLPSLLKQADRAAAVADRFVINGKRPDRYRVFVAGPGEWKKWYGGELPDWSVGFATAVSEGRMEVVLNVDEIQADYLDDVLRHELGHVATLSTDDYAHDGNFWLIEGMAEYIQENGRSPAQYDGRFAVRRFLNSGSWNGSVNVSEPAKDTADWQVAARYGVGYYAVRRMAERFGRAKTMRFFSGVVLKQGGSLDVASQAAFGVPWANVDADCAKYVRRHA
jgi:hypothetical protein